MAPFRPRPSPCTGVFPATRSARWRGPRSRRNRPKMVPKVVPSTPRISPRRKWWENDIWWWYDIVCYVCYICYILYVIYVILWYDIWWWYMMIYDIYFDSYICYTMNDSSWSYMMMFRNSVWETVRMSDQTDPTCCKLYCIDLSWLMLKLYGHLLN